MPKSTGLKSLKEAPPFPEEWIDDVYCTKDTQLAMDIWKKVHNLKVLQQRKAFREFFGFDAAEYPDYQTEEYIRKNM